MSRIRLGVVGALLALTVSAAAASTASAEATLSLVKCEGAIVTLCYSTTAKGLELFELTGTEETSAKNKAGEEPLLLAVLGEEVHIVCKASSAKGTFNQAANLAAALKEEKGKITFSECTLLEPLGKKCKVPATLETKEIKASFPTTGETVFSPETGTTFIEIAFTNNGTETCPATIKGTQAVTGTQTCTNVAAEEDLAEHEQKCEPSGSKLKLGGSSAEFLLIQNVKLVNDTTDFSSISKG